MTSNTKKKYRDEKKIDQIENLNHTRNFGILKRKLKSINNIDDPFSEWKKYVGKFNNKNIPIRNDQPMKLINTVSSDGICTHCLCGHRTGKLKKNIKTSPPPEKSSDLDDKLDKAADLAQEENKSMIEDSAKNSLTTLYAVASLLPMVRSEGDEYILVGKACAKYFKMNKKQIADAFKNNIDRVNPPRKARQSHQIQPLILEQEKYDPNIITFGKFKGQTIESIYNAKGGDMYLEWVERVCDLSHETKNLILNLLHEKI